MQGYHPPYIFSLHGNTFTSFFGSFPSPPVFLITSVIAFSFLGPLPSRGQPYSSCTVNQLSAVTEDARSTFTEEWNEDESSWNPDTRTIISYEGGNPTKVTFQEHEQSGSWQDVQRSYGTYDNSDRITRCNRRSRQDGTFVNDFREDFSYDSNGRLKVEASQRWETDTDPQGRWVNFTRSTHSYDDDGNLTQLVDEKWDRDSDAWMNSTRTSNTYDSNDRVIESLEEEPDGNGGWRNSQLTQSTYGSEGTTESVTKSWDQSTSTWQNSSRALYSYPASDVMKIVTQTWNEDKGTWVNSTRTTIDGIGDPFPPSETLSEIWDKSQGQWVNRSRIEFSYTTYNGDRRTKRRLVQTWTASSSEWTNFSRKSYSYEDVIPVELVSFRAALSGGSVQLRWQTASETGNAGFHVQRKNGEASTEASWHTIGQVEGQGTTAEMNSYRFTDENLPYEAEKLSYRLKQVDTDGGTNLSDPVQVELGAPHQVELRAPFPNPASNQVTVRYAIPEEKGDQATRLVLYDVLGRRVQTIASGTEPGQTEITRQITGLSAGTYFLRLTVGDTGRTKRFTVIR